MSVDLSSIRSRLRTAGGVVCGGALIAFTSLVLYTIVMRYFFSAPPMWGEEIPKFLFIWMIFIGAGFAYLSGSNIRMTVIIDMVPTGPRRIIELVMHLAVTAMLIAILYYSVPVLELTFSITNRATGFSEGWKYLALPVGCLLLLANEAYRIWIILRGGIDTSGSVGDLHK